MKGLYNSLRNSHSLIDSMNIHKHVSTKHWAFAQPHICLLNEY